MPTETLIYIIITGILALLLALFQYRKKSMSPLYILFCFLRFVTYFAIGLLLVNPKFELVNIYTEKPNLVIAVDNSNSIQHLGQVNNVNTLLDSIKNNSALNEAFNIDLFSFGETLATIDSLDFNDRQTNIDKTFDEISQIYKNTVSPIVLISDGNQTYGSDYIYNNLKNSQPIYPIILGDTITYSDLKIQQLNVNKYAFLKNKFPVEVILVSNGNSEINSRFVVTSGTTEVFSKSLKFSKSKNSEIINFNLPANRVGVYSYKATIIPIDSEKNTINNSKNFAVEVIDEKTNVAIVSHISHPDLGSLKKSIETNQQRKVTFFKPNEIISKIDDYQLIVLYQPNNSFNSLYAVLDEKNKNRFVITGSQTNWRFLNSKAKSYTHTITSQTENYQAELNSSFSAFIINNLSFESFPPLKSSFGETSFSVPYETILYKKLRNISTESPLLMSLETNGRREALLLGENIWKWRAQSYLDEKSFHNFDDFIGKLVQYLSSNKRNNRLSLDYQSFYEGSSNVMIKAQFFNKNYEFDNSETIQIFVKNEETGITNSFPFILRNNNYQVDLSHLQASDYSFTVKTNKENMSRSGRFKILEYNIEQQFLNADVTKLQQLATNSNGSSYFIANYNNVFKDLTEDKRFALIQKSNKEIVPLIDWIYLLILIILCLTIEWFMRKYNGLI